MTLSECYKQAHGESSLVESGDGFLVKYFNPLENRDCLTCALTIEEARLWLKRWRRARAICLYEPPVYIVTERTCAGVDCKLFAETLREKLRLLNVEVKIKLDENIRKGTSDWNYGLGPIARLVNDIVKQHRLSMSRS